MTADDIVLDLSLCRQWVKESALLIYPSRRGQYYETTRSAMFTEVTVRVPTVKIAKRTGKRYGGLQRRRIDLVALIQANKFKYEPVIAGVEIKVSPHDLANDAKLTDYLSYCHLFYLAVPASLEGAAREKVTSTDSRIGILTAGDKVEIARFPAPLEPADIPLKEIYAELLIKAFFRTGED